MGWELFAIGVLVGVALVFALRALRNQLGHDEVDTQLERWLRSGWPLLFFPFAFVPFAFDLGIEASERSIAGMSLALLAWAAGSSWRFVRRDRRLGSVLVKVPTARYAAVSHGAVAALFLLMISYDVYRWRSYELEFPWLIGAWLALGAQSLALARAGVEIREGGVCRALNECRWQEVRRWWWQGSNLRPLLMLDIGVWSPLRAQFLKTDAPN